MSKYLCRDLSWLDFNNRCLDEARNSNNPLLERGNFISICQSNLDEYFMVRVGGLVRDLEEGTAKKDISGLKPLEQLNLMRKGVRAQVAEMYDIMNSAYIPALEKEGIHLLQMTNLSKEQQEYLQQYFAENVEPLLTPRVISPTQPFPLLAAKVLHLALLLPPKGKSAETRFALLTLPSSLPRIILLPEGEGKVRGVMLEDLVSAMAEKVFAAKPIVCQAFRITRNTDFMYNDSDADALIVEMRKNLKQRKWGRVVRLEIPESFDHRLLMKLKKYLDVAGDDIYPVPGPINPNYFSKQLHSLEGFDHLRYTPFTPHLDSELAQSQSIFDVIARRDCFFFHPYDSFDPIVRFLNEAADDPDVLAIKQTLYRVSGKSPIVAALSRAAQNGKQVTVLIEVRARFDEENNINWCLALEKAGCHVIYGVPNLKAHSKITLVIRKEDSGLKRYVHLGTGNYNDVTARIYTDMGLLTANEDIGRDAGIFFNNVTGYCDAEEMTSLTASPHGIREKLNGLIEREADAAQKGEYAHIICKMNALTDKKMIKRLVKAADAGVQVDLIVRGACCLKIGKHENITVRSIVGRFLEHARVYYFENGGEREVFLSSADLMTRNLDKRVELLFPILDAQIRDRICHELEAELADTANARQMQPDGSYLPPLRGESSFSAQSNNIPV